MASRNGIILLFQTKDENSIILHSKHMYLEHIYVPCCFWKKRNFLASQFRTKRCIWNILTLNFIHASNSSSLFAVHGDVPEFVVSSKLTKFSFWSQIYKYGYHHGRQIKSFFKDLLTSALWAKSGFVKTGLLTRKRLATWKRKLWGDINTLRTHQTPILISKMHRIA